MAVENEWTSTIEALRDANSAQEELISSLMDDIIDLKEKASLYERLLAQLYAKYEMFNKAKG